MKQLSRISLIGAFLLCATLVPTPVRAGTTGGIDGRVTDAASGAPVSGATVTASSPSQTATQQTDASGAFRFNSLGPDDYTITVSHAGYGALKQPDVFIFADQTESLALKLGKAASAGASSAVGVVQPGVTSNIASIDAGSIQTFRDLQGRASYDQTYAAMNSIPGIFSPQEQAGWYQTLYIRGGDQDQVGYEYDGIPAEKRDWQSSPLTNFSTLGVQELQVYTGGILATSDATGISGYVNQVVKSGTSPGFATLNVASGFPSFYHSAEFEAGNASKNFSYYVGLLGANSTYRYINQDNSSGLSETSFFFPVQIQNPTTPGGAFTTYTQMLLNPVAAAEAGAPGSVAEPTALGQGAWNGTPGFVAAPGYVYSIASIQDRENVVNLHFGVPHKNGGADDIQLLWMESEMSNTFNSSLSDYGGPWPNVSLNQGVYGGGPAGGSTIWEDGSFYNGAVFAPPQTGDVTHYSFPSSPAHAFDGPLSPTQPDAWSTQAAIVKLQYQWNINDRSFLRTFAYTTYSDWLLNAPASLNFGYGLEAADWEPTTHTNGVISDYDNQLSKNDHLTVSASYEHTLTHGWSSFGLFGNEGTPTAAGTPVTNYATANGYCYDPATGAQISCYATTDSGNATRGWLTNLEPTAPSYACPKVGAAAACAAHPQWLVTETAQNYLTWDATPVFYSAAFNNQWRPNDKMTLDLGMRVEDFSYNFPNVLDGYPARAFWFNVYNNEHCYGPGQISPIAVTPGTGGAPPICPTSDALYSKLNLSPTSITPNSPSSTSSVVFEPRGGIAYTLDSNDVLRGSYGVYARPPTTAWMQFGGQMQDLASFIGNGFSYYGFNSPVHDIQPDRSYNVDASWEHEFKGSDIGFRITPYLRSTSDQQQVFEYDAVLGLTAGLNVGNQTSSGVEFELAKGNFNAQGLSFKLSYTHNHSLIKYGNFSNGNNVIDSINYYVREYNQFTKWCAPPNPNPTLCGANYTGANAQPVLNGIANPYYSVSAPATLFDRNASYTTYDIFPAPFVGDNGYEMPDFGSLTVNYRHDKWSITPSLTFASGSSYGNPLTTPGYDPSTCTSVTPGSTTPNLTTCTGAIFTPRVGTQFDQIGEFRQPWHLSGNLQMSYQINRRVTATVTMMHLFDACGQRGYAWDQSSICVYSQLPSNVLPPAGNFATAADPAPSQLKYPYAAWNSNENTDYLGVTTPLQINVNVDFKL